MAFELLSLSPATPIATADRRRQKTPLPESEFARKYFLVVPKGCVPTQHSVSLADLPLPAGSFRYLPSNVTINSRSTLSHAHSETEQYPTIEAEHPKHIAFPFDLRGPSAFNAENSELIFEFFPEAEALTFDKRCLRLLMEKLPPKPWPRTVAGVPAYFTSDRAEEGPIPPIKRFGSHWIRPHGDIDCRDDPANRHQLFELIKNYFCEVGIEITEIQYWLNVVVVIVLEDDETDMTAVPREVASCSCFYLFESEMGRPSDLPALRTKDPGPQTSDDSEYSLLRPGVMLGSAKDDISGYELRTTAGILIKDKDGNEYLTAASHGFPHDPRVFHPHVGGREVGEVVVKLPHTDVALVKIRRGEKFTNEMFESSHMLKAHPPLQGFMPADDIKTGSKVYMDSAFTGYGEGIAMCAATTRIPADNPDEPKRPWVHTRWHYMGQGSSQQYVNGSCGSVIWNDEGKVLGFFRYAPTSGHFLDWCQSVSADHLIDRGFTVV